MNRLSNGWVEPDEGVEKGSGRLRIGGFHFYFLLFSIFLVLFVLFLGRRLNFPLRFSIIAWCGEVPTNQDSTLKTLHRCRNPTREFGKVKVYFYDPK